MIGVIADDLTGAAEIGAVGLRHGLRAEIVLAGASIPVLPESGTPEVDILCLDTDSRMYPAEDAARRARAAASWLRLAGARWIFKKVDSVLRGQVTAEIEAVMNETNSALAILMPANPGLGRVIRDGRYYVRGKPVNETEFAFDAAYPRTSAFVLEMVSPPPQRALRACAAGDALPESGIVIGEAESSEHLDHWAATGGKALRAGGAEFFAALLRAEGCKLGNKPKPRAARSARAGRELFVCGSNSTATREFHASAQAAGYQVIGLPAHAANENPLTNADHDELVRQVLSAYESGSRVVLRVGLDRVVDPARAARLSSYVVRVAQSVLGRVAVNRVYAEGGATAVELARTLGWGRLQVLRELAPGVAALGLKGRTPAELTIKPGSYNWPTDVLAVKEVSHEPERS